ncbi:hypothetical protein M426DRAFT_7983 [Hypoxylon sp. CI-4A]|nr:hypothetical protein M426DRAFT_7983 [Hypoxylon sp. CI-4A]
MPRDTGTSTAKVTMNPIESVPNIQAAVQAPGIHGGAGANGPQGHTVVDASMNNLVGQFAGLGMNNIPGIPGMIPMVTPDGRLIHVATPNYPVAPPGMPAPGIAGQVVPHWYNPTQSEAYQATFGPSYPAQSGYTQQALYAPSYPPGRTSITHERTNTSSRDVPALDIRRSSYSTNESTPATPFLGGMASRDQGARVTVFDRSAYTTPSPQQIVAAHALQEPKSNMTAILDREPKIPCAIPAVFTPPEHMKTLEQSLARTQPGNRNVYIRGLHPITDDELLLKYAERFGKVESSKAIIDSSTGACKGFGFAKFFDIRDSEECIRGFYQRGYEVGFARESFNSRLRQEGDPDSTNLYLSNLPRSWGEQEICALFLGRTVLSSKVLRDNTTQNSRGVGFARFESREVCDEIIEDYTGVSLGPEGLALQIRYADTPEQKELKRITAERRQWRTNEYNASAYGTTLVGLSPAHGMTNRQAGGASNGASQNGGRGRNGQTDDSRQGSSDDSNNDSNGDSKGDSNGGSNGGTHVCNSGCRPGDNVEIRVESPLIAVGSTQSSPIQREKQ